ncbi:PTS system glucose-specific EIIBC component [Pseudescherichia vulneris]|nr:PTS system glucose-specific EIIBC component [Pseudescherichia vulneris]
MAVVAPLVLHLPAEEITAKHLADTGVLGGIIAGAIAAYMFNRFYRIKLPEYLGFFAGKRFVPIISGLAAIFMGVILSLHLATDRYGYPDLLPVGCLPEPGCGVWYLRLH